MTIVVDYYNIEELLSEEERMVRDVARRFVEDEFMPRIQKCFREGSFPMELVPRLGELGFLGMTLPTEYGCAGLNNVAYGLVSQEWNVAIAAFDLLPACSADRRQYPIFTFGSERAEKFLLPTSGPAEAIGCFGLTDQLCSNPRACFTRVKREWRLCTETGIKRWITIVHLRLAVVWAKLESTARCLFSSWSARGIFTR